MTPEEMLKYATEFEFPITGTLYLTIEKDFRPGENRWSIQQANVRVFDFIEGRFVDKSILQTDPSHCYASLEHAFRIAQYIAQREKEKEEDPRRCKWCGKVVGERNLKEAFGFKFCQECYDKID